MNILLTGGAGYIGYELTKALLIDKSIERITIYDNFYRGNYHSLNQFINEPKINFIRGDILDSNKLEKALYGIDAVCHLAAIVRAPFNEEFTHLFEQTNHWGTSALCDALEKSTVNKLIYLSSAAVYGMSEEPFSIESNPTPSASYGHSKLNGENQLERIKAKIDVITLRLGNVFGLSEAMHHGSLINKFNLEMAFNEPLLIHGCGSQVRPFIHISRAAKSICFFLSKDYNETKGQGLYNIYDYNVSINEILECYQALSLDFQVIHVNQHQRLKDIKLSGNDTLHRFIGNPKPFISYIQQNLFHQ
tara:strand:+ start:156 stop:1070 length:915 start_codon:yes stop_codon:yes gene_type:complete